jgi:glutaminase
MDYKNILAEIYKEVTELKPEGEVASYIPELNNVDANKFAIHLITIDGEEYFEGNNTENFSIQSISKVPSLALAFSLAGNKIWERIGVEPSGNPFNSIMQLEFEKGIPRNPFINPGAIVMADILVSHLANPEKDYLAFIQKLSGNENISYNEKVAASEKEKGNINVALINVLKHFGNINNDIETVLNFYYHQSAVEMSCRDLCKSFLPFANHQHSFIINNTVLTNSQVKRINAIMQTCGLYDESGEFAYKVGLPGKSGVGGGIVAIHPDKYCVAVWSPRLNKKGNAVLGIKSLELLTTKTGLSIF